jgi:hypothetical protein
MESVGEMNFGKILDSILSSGFTFRARGFFNVEGGQVGIATKMLPWCDCMSFNLGPAESCGSCKRNSTNYMNMIAGNGDGVYVVFEIVRKVDKSVVGALTMFDNEYQIANQIRTEIQDGNVPAFPKDLVKLFAKANPLEVGKLKATKTIFVADSGSTIDSSNAVVDVHLSSSQPIKIVAFADEISGGESGWVDHLMKTQGLDRSSAKAQVQMSKAFGEAAFEVLEIKDEPSLPSFIPRAILAMSPELEDALSIKYSIKVSDWQLVAAQFAGTSGTSHTEPQNISTIWMNVMLAMELDRAAGENISEKKAKELLFDMWTWAYQGASLGDEDCAALIASNPYSPTDEEVSGLLRRRGLYEDAEKALSGDLPETPTSPPLAPAPSASAEPAAPRFLKWVLSVGVSASLLTLFIIWLSNGQVPGQLTPFAVSATAASAVFLVVSLLGRKFRKKSRGRSAFFSAAMTMTSLLSLEALLFTITWPSGAENAYVLALMVVTVIGAIHVARVRTRSEIVSAREPARTLNELPEVQTSYIYILLFIGIIIGLVLQTIFRIFVSVEIWQVIIFWVANTILIVSLFIAWGLTLDDGTNGNKSARDKKS